MSADKAIQIKGMLSRKKDRIKDKKRFKIVFFAHNKGVREICVTDFFNAKCASFALILPFRKIIQRLINESFICYFRTS